jgi:hypothetical protein
MVAAKQPSWVVRRSDRTSVRVCDMIMAQISIWSRRQVFVEAAETLQAILTFF